MTDLAPSVSPKVPATCDPAVTSVTSTAAPVPWSSAVSAVIRSRSAAFMSDVNVTNQVKPFGLFAAPSSRRTSTVPTEGSCSSAACTEAGAAS